jgi:hypothetical protein
VPLFVDFYQMFSSVRPHMSLHAQTGSKANLFGNRESEAALILVGASWGAMKPLRRIAVVATCSSGFVAFLISNTFLVWPPHRIPCVQVSDAPPCVTVFHLPFSDMYLDVPGWMDGVIPPLLFLISGLVGIACWVALFVRWCGSRRTVHGRTG